jgi:hypothetical protein
VTDIYAPDAEEEIKDALERRMQKPVMLSLDQIVLARSEQKKAESQEKQSADTALVNPVQAKLSLLTAQEEMGQAIKNAVFFPLNFVKVDPEKDVVIIHPKASRGVSLAILRSVEDKLHARFPDWTVTVIPPVQALPYIFYEIGQDWPSGEEEEKIGDIVWALRRWDVTQVAVVGYASTIGEFENFSNASLAYRRANFVVKRLKQEGIEATTRAEYRSYNQKREERNYGVNSFHRVEVRLVKNVDVFSEPESAAPEPPPDRASEGGDGASLEE